MKATAIGRPRKPKELCGVRNDHARDFRVQTGHGPVFYLHPALIPGEGRHSRR